MTTSLAVALNGQSVGTLVNLPGDYNVFAFDEEYAADPGRPVLSQAFYGAGGQVRTVTPRVHREAPPYFGNLLPEAGSRLREYLAREHEINETRDFPFLDVLGADMPGAVERGRGSTLAFFARRDADEDQRVAIAGAMDGPRIGCRRRLDHQTADARLPRAVRARGGHDGIRA